MVELNEAQQGQLYNMVKDGSTNSQIKGFFQNTYQIEILDQKIYTLRNALKKSAKGPRKYTKKAKPAAAASVGGGNSKDEIMALIDDLFAECEAYIKFVNHKIRRELIKRRAEVRQKRIDVGEDVEAIKEES